MTRNSLRVNSITLMSYNFRRTEQRIHYVGTGQDEVNGHLNSSIRHRILARLVFTGKDQTSALAY